MGDGRFRPLRLSEHQRVHECWLAQRWWPIVPLAPMNTQVGRRPCKALHEEVAEMNMCRRKRVYVAAASVICITVMTALAPANAQIASAILQEGGPCPAPLGRRLVPSATPPSIMRVAMRLS